MEGLTHKILVVLTALTIIGEIASIALWIVNPPLGANPNARFTLAIDYTIAVANAAVFMVLNLIALVYIVRRNKMGSIFLIAISIFNRIVSHQIFIGGAHLVFILWTVLLIIFAYFDHRKLSKKR